MKPAPKIPLVYRLVAFAAALAIGLYMLQIYVFGAKFAGAVAALSRMADEPKPAPFAGPSDPGMVPVMIIKEQPKQK